MDPHDIYSGARESSVVKQLDSQPTTRDLERGATVFRGPSPHTESESAAERTRGEISTVERMLKQLEIQRLSYNGSDNPQILIKNLEHDTTLRTHLIKLRNKLNVLEWRAFATRKTFLNLDPVVVERLLDIQREAAASTGALAALGAGISLSILYSATRGDMWPIFVAWWLFIISLALTSALATSSSASAITASTDLLETDRTGTSDGSLTQPTPRNWFLQRLSVFLVFVSLCSSVGGFAALSAGVAAFSVSDELRGEDPRITGGPDLGPEGIHVGPRLVTYLIIGIFGSGMCGAYIYRLRFSIHAKSYGRSFFSGEDDMPAK